jgi:hypothetical protein
LKIEEQGVFEEYREATEDQPFSRQHTAERKADTEEKRKASREHAVERKDKANQNAHHAATKMAKAKAKAKRTVASEATAEGIAAAADRAAGEQDETVAAESECRELERRPNADAARNARKSQLQSTGCFNCGRLVHFKRQRIAKAVTDVNIPADKAAEFVN